MNTQHDRSLIQVITRHEVAQHTAPVCVKRCNSSNTEHAALLKKTKGKQVTCWLVRMHSTVDLQLSKVHQTYQNKQAVMGQRQAAVQLGMRVMLRPAVCKHNQTVSQ